MRERRHAAAVDPRADVALLVDLGDPPDGVAFIEEWPSFALIGASVLEVLSRLDAAMTGWSSMQLAAGRPVPPAHRPKVLPPRRSSFRLGPEPDLGSEPGVDEDDVSRR